jgi:hypothetical protein
MQSEAKRGSVGSALGVKLLRDHVNRGSDADPTLPRYGSDCSGAKLRCQKRCQKTKILRTCYTEATEIAQRRVSRLTFGASLAGPLPSAQ